MGMVDGEDTYARIQQTTHLPLIVIGVQEEAVEVLELGADAFMVKPPSLTELVARVRRLLQQKSRVGTRGDKSEPKIENDLTRRRNGLSTLGAVEYCLTLCLIFSKGRVIDYSKLVTEAWKGKDVSAETLHAHMRSLSKKLQAFFRSRVKIVYHPGIGYSLEEEDS